MFEVDQVGLIRDVMKDIVMEIRMKDKLAYEVVEDYMIKENFIVSGNMGVKLLLDEERGMKDFIYTCFCEDSFYHANNLANVLYKAVCEAKFDPEERIVSMRTVRQNQKYAISFNRNIIIELFELKKVGGIETRDIITPSRVKLFSEKRVLALPPEVQLLDIYQSLYSPISAGDWLDLDTSEKKLRNWLSARLAKGGDESKKKSTIPNNVQKIILTMLTKPHHTMALSGEFAMQKLKIIDNPKRIVHLTSTDIDKDLVFIKTELSNVYPNVPITHTKRNMNLLNDFRLVKVSIKMGGESDSREIIHMYNSGEYELLPYQVIDGIKVMHPYVLLRFALIEIWTLKWIKALKIIPDTVADEKYSYIVANINKLWGHLAKMTIEEKFQSQNYHGYYIKEDLAYKMYLQKNKKRFPYYYPEIAIRDTGKVRDITRFKR